MRNSPIAFDVEPAWAEVDSSMIYSIDNQYILQGIDKHHITQERFQEFLEKNFPNYSDNGVITFRQLGMIKLLGGSIKKKNYEITEFLEDDGNGRFKKNSFKLHLEYRPDETSISVTGRNADSLIARLKEMNGVPISWTEKKNNYRHS